jgi:hypothetical protein
LIASVSMGGSLPSKGGPIGYLKSINRSSLDSRICLTLDSFRSPSCRKLKAVVRPYPGAGLSQNIAFRAAFGIAYSPSEIGSPCSSFHIPRGRRIFTPYIFITGQAG